MRKLKFRAWDRYAKKMCDVYTIDFPTGHLFTDIGDSHLGAEVEALMQSTGLHDKNGVEIFEGDILSNSFMDDAPNTKSWVVWRDGAWRLKNRKVKGDRTLYDNLGWCSIREPRYGGVEVIGNIYETPELLEDENV